MNVGQRTRTKANMTLNILVGILLGLTIGLGPKISLADDEIIPYEQPQEEFIQTILNHPMMTFLTKKSEVDEKDSIAKFERDRPLIEMTLEDLARPSKGFPLRAGQFEGFLVQVKNYLDLAELLNQGEVEEGSDVARLSTQERLSTQIIREILMLLAVAPLNETSSFHIAVLTESLKHLGPVMKEHNQQKDREDRGLGDFSSNEDIEYANIYLKDVILALQQARIGDQGGKVLELNVESLEGEEVKVVSRKHEIDHFADLNRDLIDVEDGLNTEVEFGPYRYSRATVNRIGIQEYVALQGKATTQNTFSILSKVLGAESAQSVFGWMSAVSESTNGEDLGEDPEIARSVVEAIAAATTNGVVENLTDGLSGIEGRLDPNGYFRAISAAMADNDRRTVILKRLGAVGAELGRMGGNAVVNAAGLKPDAYGAIPAVDTLLSMVDAAGSLVGNDALGDDLEEGVSKTAGAVRSGWSGLRDTAKGLGNSGTGRFFSGLGRKLTDRANEVMDRVDEALGEEDAPAQGEGVFKALPAPVSGLSCQAQFM